MKYLLSVFFLLSFIENNHATEYDFGSLDSYFGSYAQCYGRSYTEEHLNKHPKQKVGNIAISHFPYQQRREVDADGVITQHYQGVIMNLDVLMLGSGDIWAAETFCNTDEKNDRLECRLECDAGYFYLKATKNGLLLTGGSDIYFDDCDVGGKVLKRKPDDTSFLLSQIPFSHCVPQRKKDASIFQPR